MPPVRSLASAKPIKTERTREENKERQGDRTTSSLRPGSLIVDVELTLRLHGGVIVLSKHVLNLPDEHLTYTRSAPVAHCESRNRMSLARRFMRKRTKICQRNIDASPRTCKRHLEVSTGGSRLT